jgi:hypothetical protein
MLHTIYSTGTMVIIHHSKALSGLEHAASPNLSITDLQHGPDYCKMSHHMSLQIETERFQEETNRLDHGPYRLVESPSSANVQEQIAVAQREDENHHMAAKGI